MHLCCVTSTVKEKKCKSHLGGTCCRLWRRKIVCGLGSILNFPSSPKWGEHRKEMEPNRGREKRGAQEREIAKIRKRKRERKDNQVSRGSSFNPLAFYSLLASVHPLLLFLLFFSCYFWVSVSIPVCIAVVGFIASKHLHLFIEQES